MKKIEKLENLGDIIATRLKGLRSQRAWSLETCSQHTGVSKAMLGQIERGESSPTIATLWKIAAGFNVPFSYFVEEARVKTKTLDFTKDPNFNVTPVFAYDPNCHFEAYSIELAPGATQLSPAHQSGVVEHIIVAQGVVDVLVGETWHSLKAGEGFRFNANQTHGYRNPSNERAVFHDLLHYLN
jgi:transcriptional regulator with XRE-family HTH domain